MKKELRGLMDSHFTEVQLGHGTAHKLVNEAMRQEILERLVKNYGIVLAELPVKYTRGAIHTRNALLKAQLDVPYIFLYITAWRGISLCLYLTHSGAIYSVTMRVRAGGDQLFGGYIIARELHLDDIFVMNGKSLPCASIDSKLKAMNEFVDHKYRHDPVLDVFRLKVLEHVESKHWRSYLADKPELENVIIIPLNGEPVRMANAKEVLRGIKAEPAPAQQFHVRPPTKPGSVTFLLETSDKPDVYNLYLQEASGKLGFYDIASIPDKKSSQAVLVMLTGGSRPAGGAKFPVICKYDSSFQRWFPIALGTKIDSYASFFT